MSKSHEWNKFLGMPIQEMAPEEQEYAALEIKQAARNIINQNRSKSSDWFVGLAMLLREEGQRRQAKDGSAD